MMLIKFKKYWNEYSVVLALRAVLDPRIKFSSLEYWYSKIDPSTTNEKIEYVREKLYKLFEEYANDNNTSSTFNVRRATTTLSQP